MPAFPSSQGQCQDATSTCESAEVPGRSRGYQESQGLGHPLELDPTSLGVLRNGGPLPASRH